ncbi:MAG: hypothetical protein MJ232_07150 [archaeon]|nr:hypothetical protein [archaeon]
MDREQFEILVKDVIKHKLEKCNIKFNNNMNVVKIDFDKDPFEKIIGEYIKTKRKYFLVNKKFNVVYSKEFSKKYGLLTKNQLLMIKDIEEKINMNKNIKPYLSNNLYLSKFSKKDELLEDYNIYHLHLGLPDKNEHFVSRTDKLLFFSFDEENVYFLDIRKHPLGDEWNDILAVKIVNNYVKENINDINKKIFKTKQILIKELNTLYQDEKDLDIQKMKLKISKLI